MLPITSVLTLLVVRQVSKCDAAPLIASNQIVLDAHQSSAEDIRAALQQSSIIPDVLPDFLPTHSLTISYPSAHTIVKLGNEILPSSVSSPPIFEIHSLSSPSSTLSPTRTLASNTTYTLVLSDPDATSRANPTKGEMCHWITTGITLTNVNASSGLDERSAYTFELSPEPEVGDKVTELMKYLPPSPPPKTGYHRYVFVLLAPEGDGRAGELKKPNDRPHWGYGKIGKGVKDWATDNGLVAVGANFFYSENGKQ